MTVIGSNAGSSSNTPGGVPESYLQQEQSSFATHQRQALGLFANLDNISLDLIGYRTLWQYDTAASKPGLNKPNLASLEKIGTETAYRLAWQDEFDDLLDELPTNVRQAYEFNLTLPQEEKIAALIDLGKLLEAVAIGIAYLKERAERLDPNNPLNGPESLPVLRRELNIAISENVPTGILNHASENYSKFNNALSYLGPNHKDFDELAANINDIGAFYQTLKELKNE